MAEGVKPSSNSGGSVAFEVDDLDELVKNLKNVAPEHRTDNLTAATQAMGSQREFTDRWQQFMAHYAVTPTTNNPGVSHENGSVEKSHDTFQSQTCQGQSAYFSFKKA